MRCSVCEVQTGCVDIFTKDNAEMLLREWNSMVIDTPFTEAMMKKYNLEDGAIFIIKSDDSCMVASFPSDQMDHVLAFLKRECARDFSVDYDICQLLNGMLAHILNSRILAKVGSWQGFDESKITVAE